MSHGQPPTRQSPGAEDRVRKRGFGSVIARADDQLMAICLRSGAGPLTAPFVIALTWASNGWIYLPIAILCLLFGGRGALGPMIAAATAAGALHSIYPFVKRAIARPRPFMALADVRPLLATMDEHSFPSGHAMTLTAVLLPLCLAFPPVLGPAILAWCGVAWARVASAHHYPSDVLGGTVLGGAAGYVMAVGVAAWLP